MESLHSAAKGAGYFIVAVLALSSCSSSQKSTEAPVPAPVAVEKAPATPAAKASILPPVPEEQWRQGLSISGLSDRPIFSRDGRKILFISRERSLHRSRQLYEFNPETKEERRLTFQDGDVFEAVVSEDDDSIYYTSTTDQIKERPVLFFPEERTAAFPSTDIYRMRPTQSYHERLTNTPAYEGFLHYHSEVLGVSFLTASRQVGDDLHLVRTVIGKPLFETPVQKPGYYLHSFTTNKARKWRAWVEEDRATGASQIAVSVRGQKPQSFKTGLVEVRDIQLLENPKVGISSPLSEQVEILLTGKLQKGMLRQAYWLKLKDPCYQTFMPIEATIADLKVSNDQKTLLYTLISGNRSQVFAAPLQAPTSNCEPIN